MKFIVNGRVVSGEARTGVFSLVVEVFDGDPSLGQSNLLSSQITNRNGEFSFVFRNKQVEAYAESQRDFFIQTVDANAQILTEPQPVTVVFHQAQFVELTVKPEKLENSKLPPQPTFESVVPTEVFSTVDLAVQLTYSSVEVETAQRVAQSFYCSLPPISGFADIIDVAQGVLQGRTDDMRRFQSYLDNMEIWNQRSNSTLRRQLNKQQAEYLLSNDFLDQYIKEIKAARQSGSYKGIVTKQNGVTLLIAAVRVAANKPAQIHRNLGIINEQFCGLRGLTQLSQAALNALSGSFADQAFFRRTLDLMGGICPDTLPRPFPPDPSPIPCGTPFWPPNPDDPSIPLDPGIEDCTPEAVRAFREIQEREVTYTIDSVSPANPCPGQEIVIRGSNFEFEGRGGVVLFAGRPRGTKIPAIPTSYSATEIRVIVPEGATCGDLELEVPDGAASILVCDVTIQLFHGPVTPFRLSGGNTTIEFFTAGSLETCLSADDSLTFRWSTCNASTHTLEITDDLGLVLLSETVDSGNFVFTVPTLDRDTRLTATLIARGPCGTDQEQIGFTVHRGTLLRADELIPFVPLPFFNWHRNVRRSVVGIARPTNLGELVRAVQTSELANQRIGVQGSAWSYTDCVVPSRTTNLMIDTSALGAVLSNVLPFAQSTGVRSVLSPALETELRSSLTAFSPISNRLVHVEAGIKIHALNCVLDLASPALALPTMGGDKGQSIAGAINTGTHGANAKLPPIADFVRAIHLVGTGGQEWWIEPRSNPVTDREQMERLKNRVDGGLNPCLKVVYDDTLFNACLVSAGTAGIVYAYVLEAIDAHNLSSTTIGMSWAVAQEQIQEQILIPETPESWFLEATVNPTRQARVTTRTITTDLAPPCPSTDSGSAGIDPLNAALLGFLFGPGAIGAVPTIIGFGTGAVAGLMGALPFYIARRTAEITRYITNPFEWYRIIEIRDEIELIERLTTTITSLTQAIARGGAEADLAEVIPNLLNVIWQIGLYVVDGRTIVEAAQNIFTNRSQRPEGTTIRKSYAAMTGQEDCACSTMPPTPHSAFERLIESFEYALPAEQCVEFADDVLRLSDRIRGTNDAVIVILNLRFTRKTRALIGMQQFEKTGHVEIYTVRGLAGNAVFHRDLQTLAARYNAIPHWGQFHDDTLNFDTLFGSKLRNWRSAMDRLSREGRGNPSTFRHDFVLRRGLISEI